LTSPKTTRRAAAPLKEKAVIGTGKRRHSRGVETREKILAAAERMFAERGLDGVSLRDLTGEAGVELALINYHFKSKDKLFEAVLAARADLISAERRRRLSALPKRHTASDVVACFLEPYLEKLKLKDAGWRYSADLMFQIGFLERYRLFRKEHLDDTAEMFVSALAAAYPRADRRSLYWGYAYMIGCIAQVLAGSDRLAILSHGACDVRDLDTAFAQLHAFAVAGIEALALGGMPKGA
jgi:AcrR family transcriptional regulator